MTFSKVYVLIIYKQNYDISTTNIMPLMQNINNQLKNILGYFFYRLNQ
jgi:hypothetical protein